MVPGQFTSYSYYFSQIRVDPTNRKHVYALDLRLLGLHELAMQRFRKAISQPHGMVILTGPTGAG